MLRTAIAVDRLDIVKLLLAKGADINIKSFDDTLLHVAATHGSGELVELLLAQGADVNARDSIGSTPLNTAVHNENYAAVKTLLTRGADINTKRQGGYTALHSAKSKEMAEILIAAGARIEDRDDDGDTPREWR